MSRIRERLEHGGTPFVDRRKRSLPDEGKNDAQVEGTEGKEKRKRVIDYRRPIRNTIDFSKRRSPLEKAPKVTEADREEAKQWNGEELRDTVALLKEARGAARMRLLSGDVIPASVIHMVRFNAAVVEGRLGLYEDDISTLTPEELIADVKTNLRYFPIPEDSLLDKYSQEAEKTRRTVANLDQLHQGLLGVVKRQQ